MSGMVDHSNGNWSRWERTGVHGIPLKIQINRNTIFEWTSVHQHTIRSLCPSQSKKLQTDDLI